MIYVASGMAVASAVIDYIRTRAAASDDEICGALVGRAGTIVDVVAAANESTDRAHRFFISAHEVLRIERAAERRGLEITGFFHSHPNGDAVPSAYDLEHALPGFIYVIAARSGDLRAWRLRSDRSGFDEYALEAA